MFAIVKAEVDTPVHQNVKREEIAQKIIPPSDD
jgi:hypothetical protein